MGRITLELLRKKTEHNEGQLHDLEEIALHQEKIEKIELLDKYCRCLKIILLQNNVISKIENLNKLKHLTYLNLALNNIQVIENLDGCESLQKLDLTLNFIGKLTSIRSLKGNYNLEQLYLSGNPCTEYPLYKEYVIAVLPQLKQLDGNDITVSEKILCRQQFSQNERIVLSKQAAYLKQNYSTTTEEEEEEDIFKAKPVTPFNSDEAEDSEDYWNKPCANTPAARLEMVRKIEAQEEAKKPIDRKKQVKPPRKFEHPDGRPLNINEGKISFSLHDECERSQFLLDLEVPKHLCTTLIDADVQPNYVRVIIKGKVFQLALPEEVRPDSSIAQRSQTTGHLLITMPKLHQDSYLVWKGSKGNKDVIDVKANKNSNVMRRNKLVDKHGLPLSESSRDKKSFGDGDEFYYGEEYEDLPPLM